MKFYLRRPLLLTAIFLLSLIWSCKDTSVPPTLSGDEVIKRSIEIYGGPKFFNSTISFNIDDLEYKLIRQDHLTDFTVIRYRKKDSAQLLGRYRNGFQQYFINGEEQPQGTFSNNVLSAKLDGFVYTSSFPHVLIQNAITLNRKEDVTIRNKTYQVVHALFEKVEGEELDEIFLYIDPETNYLSFTAESLKSTGQYPLFKRYLNYREINGLLFSDYFSFGLKNDSMSLHQMYQGYEQADLRELLEIRYTNIDVKYN